MLSTTCTSNYRSNSHRSHNSAMLSLVRPCFGKHARNWLGDEDQTICSDRDVIPGINVLKVTDSIQILMI